LNLTSNHQFNQQTTISQPSPNHRATTNEETKETKTDRIKVDSNKELPALFKMQPNARDLIDLIDNCRSVFGELEMASWHSRWLKRAETNPDKLSRVLAEVSYMSRKNQIKTTPAQVAEDLWKRWL
jgi:hypothetical protein